MRNAYWLAAVAVLCGVGSVANAAQISGEYIEARTCDVYTGPCFANGEIGLTGREAVMAWKVDEGSWAGQDLKGLGVALIIKASDTLGVGGSFYVNPDPITSVVLVDDAASEAQRTALVQFVKDSAPNLTKKITLVQAAPISLKNDHVSGKGLFTAGKLAKIETRALKGGDCVCSNESVIYPPLAKVDNSHAAFALNITFDGKGLDQTWTTVNKRSAFLATFEK